MERQNDRLHTLRHTLCAALVSLAVYLLGLMLWTYLTLSGVVGAEQLTVGTRLMMALAAAAGAAVCTLQGEAHAALPCALSFWLLTLLGGVLCGGGVVPHTTFAQAAVCVAGASAVWFPLRGSKKRHRRNTRRKRRHRAR